MAVPEILVVEDDPSLRAVIRLVLEQAGYEIAEAPNGAEALKRLAHKAPDLMLVDARMPLMSGEELIQRVRAEPAHSAIPVVLLTGFSELVQAKGQADAVIAKPFEKDQLLKVVDDLLRSARL